MNRRRLFEEVTYNGKSIVVRQIACAGNQCMVLSDLYLYVWGSLPESKEIVPHLQCFTPVYAIQNGVLSGRSFQRGDLMIVTEVPQDDRFLTVNSGRSSGTIEKLFFNFFPISQIACGLTFKSFLSGGRIYVWGSLEKGGRIKLLPRQIDDGNGKQPKMFYVSCGNWVSFAISNEGKAYRNGQNIKGTLADNQDLGFVTGFDLFLKEHPFWRSTYCGKSIGAAVTYDQIEKIYKY